MTINYYDYPISSDLLFSSAPYYLSNLSLSKGFSWLSVSIFKVEISSYIDSFLLNSFGVNSKSSFVYSFLIDML